jgi:hypothetical protein
MSVLRTKKEIDAMASVDKDRRLITDKTAEQRIVESSDRQHRAFRSMSDEDKRSWNEFREKVGK